MEKIADIVAEPLTALLRARSGADLTKEVVASIDATVLPTSEDSPEAARILKGLRTSGVIRANDPGGAAHYAAAALEAMAGNLPGSTEQFMQLTSALERAGAWEPFVAVSTRALELTGGGEFARCLARAWEKGGGQYVTADLLVRAVEATPDDHRLRWAAAAALEAEGRADLAQRHAIAAIPGFLQKGDHAHAEEALRRAEAANDPAVAAALLDALIVVTRQAGAAAAARHWDAAAGTFSRHGLDAKVWAFFKDYLPRHPDQGAVRAAAFRAFRAIALARGLAEEALTAAGIDSTRPAAEAIARADLLLAWPPGIYVDHRLDGIGKLLANTADALRIQFPRATKELSLEIAGRSLLKLDPEDLKVKLSWDHDDLTRRVTADPASVVFSALVSLKGEGKLTELKKILSPAAVPGASWNDFWKRAQKAMKEDARFDLSQTTRKVYRLSKPTLGPGSVVPEFDVKTPFLRRVDVLERFLEESPEKADVVVQAHGSSLVRLYVKEETGSDARLAGALLLLRLNLVDDASARNECAAYFAGADDFPSSVGKPAQARCLALATGMTDPTFVYLAALSGRNRAFRDEALGLLAAHFAGGYLAFLQKLLRKSPERAPAVLHLVAQPELAGGGRSWDALLALIRLIVQPPRESHQKQALEELAENEPLRRGLREIDPDPDTWDTVRLELVSWRASERLLLPVLDALTAAGRGELADEVRAVRKGKSTTDRTPATHLAGTVGRLIMSRSSYDRLQHEVHDVGMELKTSIPQAIEIARAHGDLRENAEYQAAKEKQKRYAARLTELEDKLNRALVLDGSMVRPGVAGPGTLVRLESTATGQRLSYWVLGEGDDVLGEQVVSYLAPLGKAITGKTAGEEATIAIEGQSSSYRIISVEPKLPE